MDSKLVISNKVPADAHALWNLRVPALWPQQCRDQDCLSLRLHSPNTLTYPDSDQVGQITAEESTWGLRPAPGTEEGAQHAEGRKAEEWCGNEAPIKGTPTHHAPFCVKPFGPARLEVAGLLAGGFLQEGTFIRVQHFERVCILPNTNHLPLLGPTATLDGTLEKEAEKDSVTWWNGGESYFSQAMFATAFSHQFGEEEPKGVRRCFWRRSCPQSLTFLTVLCLGQGVGAPMITMSDCWSLTSWPCWEPRVPLRRLTGIHLPVRVLAPPTVKQWTNILAYLLVP